MVNKCLLRFVLLFCFGQRGQGQRQTCLLLPRTGDSGGTSEGGRLDRQWSFRSICQKSISGLTNWKRSNLKQSPGKIRFRGRGGGASLLRPAPSLSPPRAAPCDLPTHRPCLGSFQKWWRAGGSQLCTLSLSLLSACPTSHSIPFWFYGLIFRLKR